MAASVQFFGRLRSESHGHRQRPSISNRSRNLGVDARRPTATTQVSRKEFGVNFNGLLETGGGVVGDKVKITLHIEAIRAD